MTSNSKKYSDLKQRVLAGVIGATLIVSGIFFSAWTFFAVFFIIAIFTMLEFYKLVAQEEVRPLKYWGAFLGMAIYTMVFLVQKGLLESKYYLLLFPVIATMFLIKLYDERDRKPFSSIAFTVLGIVYVAVPMALLSIIAFSKGDYNPAIIFGIIFLHWASDTGAYFSGTAFGKTKLFERVSPKKSWEGSIGGGVLTVIVALVLAYYFPSISQLEWLLMATIVVVAGNYGDLVESLFKRSIQIKDSGTIIPGHGGFLDRFDGLLISIPFILILFKLL